MDIWWRVDWTQSIDRSVDWRAPNAFAFHVPCLGAAAAALAEVVQQGLGDEGVRSNRRQQQEGQVRGNGRHCGAIESTCLCVAVGCELGPFGILRSISSAGVRFDASRTTGSDTVMTVGSHNNDVGSQQPTATAIQHLNSLPAHQRMCCVCAAHSKIVCCRRPPWWLFLFLNLRPLLNHPTINTNAHTG